MKKHHTILVAFLSVLLASQLLTAGELHSAPWQILLKDASGNDIAITSSQLPKEQSAPLGLDGTTHATTWSNVVHQPSNTALAVTQTAVSSPDGSVTYQLTVKGKSSATLWAVSPAIVAMPTANLQLALPQQDGQLLALGNTPFNLSMPYPQTASMQFLAAWDGQTGEGTLIFAADPRFHLKNLMASSDGKVCNFYIEDIPEAVNGTSPHAISYISPYGVHAVPFKGNWQDAARLYSAKTSAATATSPIASTAFWTLTKADPYHAIMQWDKATDWLGLPVFSMYSGYTKDHETSAMPDIMPMDPYVRNVIHDANALGVSVAPTLSARRWSTRSNTYMSLNGDLSQTAMLEGSSILNRDADGFTAVDMCAACPQWQTEFLENVRFVTATLGAKSIAVKNLLTVPLECSSAIHGHARRGGTYAADAIRDTLKKARNQVRNAHPQGLVIVHGLSEALLDIADVFVPGDVEGTSIPLFDAVYHGSTILVKPEQDISNKVQYTAFATAFARNLAYGRIPAVIGIAETFAPATEDTRAHLVKLAALCYAKWSCLLSAPANPIELSINGSKPNAPLEITATSGSKPSDFSAFAFSTGHQAWILCVNLTNEARRLVVSPRSALFPGHDVQDARILFPSSAQLPAKEPGAIELPASGLILLAYNDETAPLPPPHTAMSLEKALLCTSEGDTSFKIHRSETAEELWGCDDAVVIRNPRKMHGMLKPGFTSSKLNIRKGSSYTLPSAEKSDGRALPNEWENQPFAIMEKLPFNIQCKTNVFTLMGDDNYLALNGPMAAKDTMFSTDRKGIFACKVFHELKQTEDGTLHFFKSVTDMNDFVVKTTGQHPNAYLQSIAYSAMDNDTLSQALDLSRKHGIAVGNVEQAWKCFKAKPSLPSLADANAAVLDWFLNAHAYPELFARGTAAESILRQIQCMVMAAALKPDVMQFPLLALDHDILMPNIAQTVALVIMGKKTDGLASQTSLKAIGVASDAIAISPIIDQEHIHYPGFEVTIAQPQNAPKSFILAATMPLQFHDVTLTTLSYEWVTQGTPADIFAGIQPSFVAPGKNCTALAAVQNLSPYDTFEFAVEIPPIEGWKILAEPSILNTQHYDFDRFSVFITVPKDMPEGSLELPMHLSTNQGKSTFANFRLPIEVVKPAIAAEDSKVPEKREELHIPYSSLLAVYPQKGQQLSIQLKNTSDRTLAWRLLNPDFEEARKSSLKPADSTKIALTAQRDAPYFLAITKSTSAPATIICKTHAMSRRASAATPAFIADNDRQELFFHVRKEPFTISICNAPQAASVTLRSPTGRAMALSLNKATILSPMEGETDAAWAISLENARGTGFSITGDAAPWLAPSATSVLK